MIPKHSTQAAAACGRTDTGPCQHRPWPHGKGAEACVRADLLVVIPAYNEARTIASVVRAARSQIGCPVLVVSDGSRDGTLAAARVAGALVIDLPMQLGAWGATQAGIRYARRHGFNRVVTLDADGQHDPATVPALMQQAERADVVIGMCPGRLSAAKRLAWAWFRVLTGLSVQDLTSGLRVYGPRAVRLLARSEATLLDYQDVGVLMLLRRFGLSVTEVPVAMRERCDGRSRVFSSWMLVASYLFHTTVLCVARFGEPRKPTRAGAGDPA